MNNQQANILGLAAQQFSQAQTDHRDAIVGIVRTLVRDIAAATMEGNKKMLLITMSDEHPSSPVVVYDNVRLFHGHTSFTDTDGHKYPELDALAQALSFCKVITQDWRLASPPKVSY